MKKSPSWEKDGSWHAADTSHFMEHDTPRFAHILEEYGSVSWDFHAMTRRFSRSVAYGRFDYSNAGELLEDFL